MIRECIAMLAFGVAASAAAQPVAPSPEAVVRAYADAASRHDLEGFLALYDPAVRKYKFPGEFSSEGMTHNRAAYEKSFAANPNLKVEILDVVALGDKIVSHDRVTGLADGHSAEEITAYQVQDGKITNIVYVARSVR